MSEVFDRHGCSVLGVQEIPREQSRQYGMVRYEPVKGNVERITAIVEKPEPAAAPSNLAVVGRYILTPRIFHYLERGAPGAGGEIQLTDAIAALLAEQMVLACRFRGTRYDCGSKLGYLKAMVAFGCKHPEVGESFDAYLKELGGRG
jgi:UTP--glucose-1-phosphate uridylyltransferase